MTNPMNFGDKEFDYGAGYPAPFSIPDETACRTFRIPASDENGEWLALFMGLMMTLSFPENWVQFEGAIDREDAAARWQEMIDDAYADAELACPVTTVDTPYWDDETDVDDEAEDDEQIWYGQVADAATAPTELDFIENAFVWGFTGLIAVSLGGIPGLAPALAFRTIASRFILSYKNGGGAGSIIRFFVDGVKVYEGVDSGDGSITDVTVLADPDLDDHQIYATAEVA